MIEANVEALGVSMSGFYTRNVQDCLNCTKYVCDGCPKDKAEQDKKYYQRRKARLEGEMVCPKCGGQVQVKDSRTDNNTVIRRRRCVKCGQNIYTKETMMEYATGAQTMSELYKLKYREVIQDEVYK